MKDLLKGKESHSQYDKTIFQSHDKGLRNIAIPMPGGEGIDFGGTENKGEVLARK